MAKLLSNIELEAARTKYILAAIFLIIGYSTLILHIGFWAALGVFLVHTGINFSMAADSITDKLRS